MIKTMTTNNLTISVTLKNGSKYENKDIPEAPFGQHDRVVSFWHEDAILVFPMSEVSSIEIRKGN